MTGLMTMSCRQRLLQVGTCLAARPIFSSSRVVPNQGFINENHSCSLISSGFVDGVTGGKCLMRRHISTSTTCTGTLGANAFARNNWRRGREKREEPLLLEDGEVNDESVKNHVKGEVIITVPERLTTRLDRKVRKDSTKRAIRLKILDESREGEKSKILIHCKRQEFNHYYNQTYDRRGEVPLASRAWANRKSGGDFFTIYPGFKKESPFYMKGAETLSFDELGICQQLCDNLQPLGVQTPTHIQVFGIPQVLKGGYNVVAAETGCGKTLVYLLPMIQQILEDKRHRVRPKPGQPSAVILAPSRELADQIYGVALQLVQNLDISVKLLQGGSLGSKMKNPPSTRPVDILVATTNALKVLTSAGVYGTSKILHLVLDEADTLLDDSFFPELVAPFLRTLPWKDLQRQIQLTLVSATMPKALKFTLGEIMPVDSFSYCTTPGLHYTLPHVPQEFLRLNKSRKPEKLKAIVEMNIEKKIPMLIFCNRSTTCDWMSRFLNSEGIDCATVHGRMPLKFRMGRVEAYQRGEIDILISTDLASRGIDTVRTEHVLNYEFPLHLADYIHRCGRTGRVGSKRGCHVTNFISRVGEVRAVNEIERSVRKQTVLPDIDANIKRLYGQWYGSYVAIDPIKDDKAHEASLDNGSDSDNENERS